MTIQAGIRYMGSTGNFAGMAEPGCNSDGPTPQQVFITTAKHLAARVDAAAAEDELEEGAAATAAAGAAAADRADGKRASGHKIVVASHHLVVYATCIKGDKYSTICSRNDLESVQTTFLRKLLHQLIRELWFAHFRVVSISLMVHPRIVGWPPCAATFGRKTSSNRS